jgi:hypothetical protein
LKTTLSVFKSQKFGNEPSDYEDASEPSQSLETLENPNIAISDGATESSFASLWANLLVATFVNSALPSEERFLMAVKKAARIWHRIVDSKKLPWYAEEKRKQGAFATLLGTCFTEEGNWESVAVGDSCLFKVGCDGDVSSFPIEDETEFGSTPPLVCSRSREFMMKRAKGTWASGDRFFWMTDAAAHWFLHESKTGLRPWNILQSFHDPMAFDSWLSSLRESGTMRNDDVTILMLRVE